MARFPLRLLLLVPLLLALLCLSPGWAEEDEPLDDSADGEIPFVEQVNQAIERGVRWLIAKPTRATLGGVNIAHWGLIRGDRFYGGGEGVGYGHPVGATAFSLYTLLKCGVDPEHPIVQRGFNFLRETHPLTPQFDGDWGSATGWPYNHRVARGSYEISAEILALVAKYDRYKRTKNTKLRRSRGKLKIKDKDEHEWLQELVAALVDRRSVPGGIAPGLGWRYNLKGTRLTRGRQTVTMPDQEAPPHANQDLSSTQLAALALFSAHQLSVRVPEDVWVDIVNFTIAQQEDSGPEHARHDPGVRPGGGGPPIDHARGFVYIKGSPDAEEGLATGSMTACGIANLVMAKDVLLESKKGRKRWAAQGFEARVDRAIMDGLAWLDLNWSATSNPDGGSYHLYYLYGVERAMDLINKQLVGKHVWYNEGATAILGRLQRAKATDPTNESAGEQDVVFWTDNTHEPKDVLATCFALLFLKRATRDIIDVPVTAGEGRPADNR